MPTRRTPELRRLSQFEEEGEIALEVLGNQKIFLYMLVAAFAETRGDVRMGEQEANLVGGAFDGVGEKAGVFMDDLRGNSADG